MKYLMTFMVMVLFAVSVPAMAQVSTKGLTETQSAELALTAAKMKEEASTVKTVMDVKPAEVVEYINIGTSVGQALASTARELGIEVNAFSKTSVGKLAIFLIVWHLFGAMAIHTAAGLIMLAIAIPIWIWSFRKMCTKQIRKIETGTSESGKPFKTVTYGERPKDYGEFAGVHWVFLAIIFGASILVMFTW